MSLSTISYFLKRLIYFSNFTDWPQTLVNFIVWIEFFILKHLIELNIFLI